MDRQLHKVKEEEFPVLRDWLAKYLPDTYEIYGTVCEELRGRWRGTTYYTLGWPDILAVGQGPMDETKCKCASYFHDVREIGVFSDSAEHLETLLKTPGFLDWTRPIVFSCTSPANCSVLERESNATGTKHKERYTCYLLIAEPGDVQPKPVPDGYELRPLDPDLHTDYVTSTWPYRRKYAELYVYELIKNLPSLGVFDKSTDECVAFELMSEYGFPAMLHVKEEARRRGFGTVLASHMAQICFRENRPAVTTVIVSNKPSVDLHVNIGFKIRCKVDWFVHTMDDASIYGSFES